MAHKKGQGSSRNGRDSNSQRRGVKVFGGEKVSAGSILVRQLGTVTDWQHLNLNATSMAVINQDLCIQCGRCHIACEDTSHQAITATKDGKRHFEVVDAECVGCNLCVSVCPVPDCITMFALKPGEVDTRTGRRVEGAYANWTTHPNNPARVNA